MFYFAKWLIDKHAADLPAGFREEGRQLQLACRHLRTWYDGMLSTSWVVPSDLADRLHRAIKNVCVLSRAAGPRSRLAPKHHSMACMARKLKRNGNPRKYHCYADETFNRVIRDEAAAVHRRTLAVSVMKRYRLWCICENRLL